MFFIVFTSIGISQDNQYSKVSNKDIIEDFSNKASSINTIKSDFIQKKEMSFLDNEIISQGKFIYKKGNNILWAYSDPLDYKILIKNNKMVVDDEGKKNEINLEGNKVFKQINKIIILTVSGKIINDENYNTEFLNSSNKYCLRVKSKDENVKMLIVTINLYIKKESFDVMAVELIELSGDKTYIEFKNRRINEEISDSEFVID